MPFRTPAATAVAALCLAAAAPFAHATLSVYTDEAQFLAAVYAPSTDNFADLAMGGLQDASMTRSAGGLGYVVSVADDAQGNKGLYAVTDAASADTWLSSNGNEMPIVFTGFAGNVQAIGGYFFATDAFGAPLDFAPLTVSAADADGSVDRTLASQSPTSFLGFVSDTRLDSLQVAVVSPDAAPSAWATVGNLTLGQAQALPPVPEPSTTALMLAGLAVVARVATTRRRARG